jgi:hypothetical protein
VTTGGVLKQTTVVPCLVNRVTKRRSGRADPERYSNDHKNEYSARDTLEKWPNPPCDPHRSYFDDIPEKP